MGIPVATLRIPAAFSSKFASTYTNKDDYYITNYYVTNPYKNIITDPAAFPLFVIFAVLYKIGMSFEPPLADTSPCQD
jgi:hypothetical protein